jgi:hypothetical protein
MQADVQIASPPPSRVQMKGHISAKRQDDAPIVQIWNRELSGNPSFGVTNCKPIRVRRLLDAIKFTCGRFFAQLSQ